MSPFQKWSVLLSSGAVALTGVVYWWMDTFLEPVDPWAVVNHPLQPLVLKLHILVAPVLVFAVGLIAVEHVWKHLRGSIRLARRSGLATTATLVPMIVSGYLIQAVTEPTWLAVVTWTHLATGAVFALGLVVHHHVIRRRRRARERLGGARWGAPALPRARASEGVGTEVADEDAPRPVDPAGTGAAPGR